MTNTVIYTAITGAYDELKPVPTKAPCYALCDEESGQGSWWNWRRLNLPPGLGTPERASRFPKCCPHLFLPEAEFTVWTDASIRWNSDPADLVRVLGADDDIATFRHPWRDCAYAEGKEVAGLGRADAHVMAAQLSAYLARGLKPHAGMYELSVIVRRNTEWAYELGDAWWAEQCRWTSWDQVSFPYVCEEFRARVATIPGNVRDGSLCWKEPHNR